MSKKTEWNGIISFLNILKSERRDSKGLQDLAATRSCTRVLLLRVQNIGTAGLRTWAGSQSESPDLDLEIYALTFSSPTTETSHFLRKPKK